MDRRNFLQLAALFVAGKAVERVFPFRVYSIPQKVEVFNIADCVALQLEGLRDTLPLLYDGPFLNGIPYFEDTLHMGQFMGISRVVCLNKEPYRTGGEVLDLKHFS